MLSLPPRRGALVIEREQPRERLLFADMLRPTIGRGDRGIQFAMRVIEQGRPLAFPVKAGPMSAVGTGFRR